MTFQLLVQDGSVRVPLIVGNKPIILSARPTPAFEVQSYATGPQATRVYAYLRHNVIDGTLNYLFTPTSGIGSITRGNITNALLLTGQEDLIEKTDATGNTEYSLVYYYTAPDGTTTPSSGFTTHGTTVTTVSTLPAPTGITPTALSLQSDASVSAVVGQVVANQTGCTFTEIADPSSKFSVASNGIITLSATVTAGTYSYTVRATNSGGTFDQVLTVTVTNPPSGGSSLTADSTGSTAAAVQSILASWSSNWNGTTPSGKTNSDPRVVQLTAPVTSLVISGYSFPQQVTVRGIGPYSQGSTFPYTPTTGSDIAQDLTLTGCTNVRLYGLKCRNLATGSNNSNCVIERVAFQANSGLVYGAPTNISTQWTTAHANWTDCVIRHCYWQGCKGYAFRLPSGTNITFEECTGEYLTDDFLKGADTITGLIVQRNFWPREFYATGTSSANGSHNDMSQYQSGTATDVTWWGNVGIQGYVTRNGGLENIQGGLWLSNSFVGVTFAAEQNFYSHGNSNTMVVTSGGSLKAVRNNAVMLTKIGTSGTQATNSPAISGAWNTSERNLVTSKDANATNNSGTGGIRIIVGGGSNTSPGTPDFSGYATYMNGVPNTTKGLVEIKPKVGGPMHWDYTGTQIGPSTRLREIFVDGRHLGNVGWPVANCFKRQYDPENYLTDRYTGTYDADGLNA